MANVSLQRAKKAKCDEFYTQLVDIENELKHYINQFKNKVIYCNCDHPHKSNFVKYFSINFNDLGIKKLISTCYGEKPYKKVIDKNGEEITRLEGDGDFRSEECIELLKEADIVVTNPPFSLFREYVAQLMKYKKKFLIIGNTNALTYKEIFPLIKNNKVWSGYFSGCMKFKIPYYYEPRATADYIDKNGQKWRSLGNICWLTNLDIKKRHENLTLYKRYTPEEYPKYDNYDAINVDKTSDIPYDYTGAMGVPITFIDKYNPEQFEILDANNYRKNESVPIKTHGLIKDKDGVVNGQRKYVRILIKRIGDAQ